MKEKKNKKVSKEEKIKTTKKSSKEVIKDNASFNLVEVIVIILITGLIVAVISSFILTKRKTHSEDFKEVSCIENEYLNEFYKVYNNIVNTYVTKVDEEKLINAAIKGLYTELDDPYTNYIDKDLSDEVNERLEGKFKGIGVEIRKDDNNKYVLVANVFENSPAALAGLKVGDLITKVNGNDTENLLIVDVADEIRKTKNNKVEIDFLRNEKPNRVIIETKNVVIPSVESKIIDKIGTIKISTFSNTTYNQFKEQLQKLEQEQIKGLVIDVRGNTGGFLRSAVDISELFIEKGKIIYKLETKGKITEVYKDATSEKRTYPVVVLLNEQSASAAEILAAALKESYNAMLIGKKSYGKGTVQEKENLSTGEIIKHTTAYWLTPKGNKINNIGLMPDLTIEPNLGGKDSQLNRAIEEIKNKIN